MGSLAYLLSLPLLCGLAGLLGHPLHAQRLIPTLTLTLLLHEGPYCRTQRCLIKQKAAQALQWFAGAAL